MSKCKETIGHLLEQLNNKHKANEINIKKSKQNDIIIREAKFEISKLKKGTNRNKGIIGRSYKREYDTK